LFPVSRSLPSTLRGVACTLIAVAIFYPRTVAKIAHAKRLKKRITIATYVERRAPHTPADLAWFLALSVAAGTRQSPIGENRRHRSAEIEYGPTVARAILALLETR
jgi:hypothetical protein